MSQTRRLTVTQATIEFLANQFSEQGAPAPVPVTPAPLSPH